MGDEILLGTGSQILEYKCICSNCVIGAGEIIKNNIKANQTVKK